MILLPDTTRPTYRQLLASMVEVKLAEGRSARSIALDAGITSPNFLQQVISGKRNLTLSVARRIAGVLFSEGNDQDYFVSLVDWERETAPGSRKEIDYRLRVIEQDRSKPHFQCEAIYSSWLPSVIFEGSRTIGTVFTRDEILDLYGHLAPQSDIESALSDLVTNGVLSQTIEGKYHRDREFIYSGDDRTSANLQRYHSAFLDRAKESLKDPVEDREYQGLTVAVPKNALPEIKKRIRAMITTINVQYEDAEDLEDLLHIEVGAFFLSRSDAQK